MSEARSIFNRIREDLARGAVPLALLGSEAASRSATEMLPLDTPEAMGRYALMMSPKIRTILADNRRLENVYLSFLVALFLVALGLSIAANWKGWDWTSSAVIPGLGATAVWPVRRLAQLRDRNIRLELLPLLLPVLSLEDARQVIVKLLGLERPRS